MTAAVKAAEEAWVEKAARGWWDWGATMREATGHGRSWDELDEDERALVRSRVRTALVAVLPEIQAQALEAAAEDWQRGEWANAPRRADRVQERIANAQHVGDWIRARAAHLTTTTEEPTDV